MSEDLMSINKQVFWLRDRPTPPALPSKRTVAFKAFRHSLQRRYRAGFTPASHILSKPWLGALVHVSTQLNVSYSKNCLYIVLNFKSGQEKLTWKNRLPRSEFAMGYFTLLHNFLKGHIERNIYTKEKT